MVGRLDQPDPGETPLRRPLHHRAHQLPPNGLILHRRIDRDRTNAGDRVALIEKVAADDLAVLLRHHGVEARVGENHRDHSGRALDRGKSQGKLCWLEIDLNASKSIIPHAAASSRVPGRSFAFIECSLLSTTMLYTRQEILLSITLTTRAAFA